MDSSLEIVKDTTEKSGATDTNDTPSVTSPAATSATPANTPKTGGKNKDRNGQGKKNAEIVEGLRSGDYSNKSDPAPDLDPNAYIRPH